MSLRTLNEWLAYLEHLHPTAIELGLGRVQAVKHRLGLQPDFPIVTVGGTNGKGSTCAMLETILHLAGYRVGCYTSPHLLNYNERVRIDRQPVTDSALCEAFAAVEAARGEVSLTYFEFGTLAALWLFCRSKLQAAILEVGLGGRLDAVNAFDPQVAVVTSVDLDHQQYLGDTREQIGFEKAGIYRAARPAIFGDPDVPDSVLQHAEAIGADFLRLGRDFGFIRMEAQWQFWGRRGKRHALPLPVLRGAYQLNNASACLAALDELRELLPVTLQDVKRGLLEVYLPGRLQVLPGRPTVVLDVAHNPHAARALASGLGNMGFYENSVAVFSMLQDKDIDGVIEAVHHRIDRWLVAGIEAPRGASAQSLFERLTAHGLGGSTRLFTSVASAYACACEEATQNDRIIVFGSFYTVAEVMQARSLVGGGGAGNPLQPQ